MYTDRFILVSAFVIPTIFLLIGDPFSAAMSFCFLFVSSMTLFWLRRKVLEEMKKMSDGWDASVQIKQTEDEVDCNSPTSKGKVVASYGEIPICAEVFFGAERFVFDGIVSKDVFVAEFRRSLKSDGKMKIVEGCLRYVAAPAAMPERVLS